MEDRAPKSNTEGVPVGRIFFWLFWVIEVVGFVVAFGCATVFGLGGVGQGGSGAVAGVIGMLIAAGVFVVALRMMRGMGQASGQVLLGILGVLLIANFILFGSCAAIF